MFSYKDNKQNIINILTIIMLILFALILYQLYHNMKQGKKNNEYFEPNSQCVDINMQTDIDKKTTCNNTENCYYVNNSCYDKKTFKPFTPIEGRFTCNITPTHTDDTYILQCPNLDKSTYLFNNISFDNCTSDNCNLITLNELNLDSKDNVTQYINGNLPKPLIIKKENLPTGIEKSSKKLIFTDINGSSAQIPYSFIPSVKDINISGGNINKLSPDYNLINNIQNMTSNIQKNITLLTK